MNSRNGKQGKNVKKSIIGLKITVIKNKKQTNKQKTEEKKRKIRKENSREPQKCNVEVEVYNNNKKDD